MMPSHSSLQDPSTWIERRTGRDADRCFLRQPGGVTLSYGELEVETARLAATFGAFGVNVGDRIAVQIDKSVESVLIYIAALRMGAVLMPLNTAYMPAELDYFLNDARPTLVICRPADRERIEPLASKAGVAHLETLGSRGDGSLMARVSANSAAFVAPDRLGPDSLAALIYTSGTTGRSKGAMLTRRNLASNAEALVEAWRFSADDVLLHALPLFHVHGLFAALNTVLAAGASLILQPSFDAASAADQLANATVFMGVPTYYTRLLKEPSLSKESTSRIRLFVSGSAPLLTDTHQQFENRTGHRILERYGMTETLMNTSNPYEGTRLPGSVGPPLPGVEVRVTGTADGIGPGMLEIRGSNVFKGYWNDPVKTAESFTSDGFFITGDLGFIDEAGYVHISGRAKDLVISGGYNVYPKEIESELDALPDVIESAVIGLPHPDLGEGVVAIVAVAPGHTLVEAAILTEMKSRLARYKVPRRILFVDELPRNAMGKVQKTELRRAYSTLFG